MNTCFARNTIIDYPISLGLDLIEMLNRIIGKTKANRHRETLSLVFLYDNRCTHKNNVVVLDFDIKVGLYDKSIA
jgi:hypothetical protein